MSFKLKLSMGIYQSFSASFFISFGSVSNLTLETASDKKSSYLFSNIDSKERINP